MRRLALSCIILSIAAAVTAQDIDLSLLGTTHPGFRIDGINAGDNAGRVSSAGDVNGDGFPDLLISASFGDSGGTNAGETYVVFGKADNGVVDLASLGAGGFRIDGVDIQDESGSSSSGAGDVNGDGLADLLIGAYSADPGGRVGAGESYVVFGKADSTTVDLAALGSGGFRIDGIDAGDASGSRVSGAGDVNGDGLADLIIGAYGADSFAGESYVVFGKASTTTVDLATLGSGGFRIDGIDADDQSGRQLSGAGDVNGDGLADLIIGAASADPGGDASAGECYLVFGKADNTTVDLASLGSGGFTIEGADPSDFVGASVSGAGDVNGDGLADLLLGATGGDAGGFSAGENYVVFGKDDATTVSLATLGTGGFRIDGVDSGDMSGNSVSGAGDVNGDGLADLLIGANQADPGGDSGAGESYVVFGKADTATVDLASLGSSGFRIDGIDPNDFAGAVSGVGDVNGDGLADLLIGAFQADPGGDSGAGESYLVFSPMTPPALPTYIATAKGGNAPRVAVGISGDGSDDDSPSARAFVDFADGSGPGLGSSSTVTVTLNRSNASITNLTNATPADVLWQVETNRAFTSAEVTFQYTSAEITGLTEANLTLYKANSSSGPWTPLTTTIDAARNRATATVSSFSYFVLGVNNPPAFTASGPFSVPENSPATTAVGNVDANDGDGGAADSGMTYSITSGNTGGAFAINSASGVVEVAGALDFEGTSSYVLTVQADDGVLAQSASVTINVTDVNEAPIFTATGPFTVPEDAPDFTIVGDVEANNGDGGVADFGLTYTILSGNAGTAFQIHSGAGILATDNPLNYEAISSYSLVIEASDGTHTTTGTITINVTNVNEAPTALALNNATVTEHEPNGTIIGAFSTTDPDAGDSFTYTLTSDSSGGRLTIVGNELRVAGNLEDTDTPISITVETEDTGNLTFSESFAITVTNAAMVTGWESLED